MALKESAVCAEPEINPSASTTNSTKTKDAIVTSGDRGDFFIHGFWENGIDAVIDVRSRMDTDAKSHASRDPKKILLSQEKEKKKKKYLDRYQPSANLPLPLLFQWMA